MYFYIICITLIVLLYRYFFLNEFIISIRLKIQNYFKKESYRKIDKTEQAKQYAKEQAFLRRCFKIKLLSERNYPVTEAQLKIHGVANPRTWLIERIYSALIFLIVAVFVSIINILSRVTGVGGAFVVFVTGLFAIVLITVALILVVQMPTIHRTLLKANIAAIEKDYDRLFSHLYYYYTAEGQHYMLSTVLNKFKASVSVQTMNLISVLVDNSQRGEVQALQKMKKEYASSVKLSNLADKLAKCVEGHSLAKSYLESLHAQSLAEQDVRRRMSEARKQNIYIIVMSACMVTVMLIQVSGGAISMLRS